MRLVALILAFAILFGSAVSLPLQTNVRYLSNASQSPTTPHIGTASGRVASTVMTFARATAMIAKLLLLAAIPNRVASVPPVLSTFISPNLVTAAFSANLPIAQPPKMEIEIPENLLIIVSIIFLIISVAMALVLSLPLGDWYNRWRHRHWYFSVIWKDSSTLQPEDILKDHRPVRQNYYKRPVDDLIRKCLDEGRNVLVVAPPLGGKTRAVYEALRSLPKACDVSILRNKEIESQIFGLPLHLKFWNRRVIVIDDLHRFVEQNNFEHFFRVCLENSITVIATCFSAQEYKKAKKAMLGKGYAIDVIFGKNIFEFEPLPIEAAKEIAGKNGISWERVRFNGTIGSIFMPLSEMEDRFTSCKDIEKGILQAIRDLYTCGIYEEDLRFPLEWEKTDASGVGSAGKDYEWNDLLRALQGKVFITRNGKDMIEVDEAYLLDIIKPEHEVPPLTVFKEMIPTISGLPDALIKLGNRAYAIGTIDAEKAHYMERAIEAYGEALKVYTLAQFPMDYATTQNNLGIAYRTLAGVKEKGENCRRAMAAYGEALKVYTLAQFPIDYGTTQNNQGAAFRTLAGVKDKGENCRRAIDAYSEALKVYTLRKFPIDYATTQNNLGAAHRTLAEVEEKGENCRRAIAAHGEALKVYPRAQFPINYAMTQNNLGNAYSTLAEVAEKGENCRRAMAAYGEALKAFTEEEFPAALNIVKQNLRNVREFCQAD